MGLKVVKFGGSSVADGIQLAKMKAIVEADPARRYVVVSAPGKRFSGDSKITDLLFLCKSQKDRNVDYEQLFQVIADRYSGIMHSLDIEADLDGELALIKERLEAGWSEDYIVSRGEYLSAFLVAAYLGYDFIDTKGLILFDSRGRLLAEETNEALKAELAKHEHAVIPGFYGSQIGTEEVKLLSRGGSDVTGSLVARAVGADIYENWTDVSGLLMADPRIIPNPAPIESISYMELRELSYMGASVLHEDAVFPVRESDIPINIRNTNRPDDPGTFITAEKDASSCRVISGIAGKKDFTVIAIYKNMMNKEMGFVRKALMILEENQINFDHMPTGIDSLSIVIESSELDGKLEDVLEAFERQLSPDDIEVFTDVALIAAVGIGMKGTPGSSARVLKAVADAGINLRMINQSTSEISVIIGVEAAFFEKAMQVIYKEFV
ncbi:MAG: aspartate kinase [Clostridiales bacterium]|nr:aspartate kinase [Candidatus Crickella merdequi]